MLGLLGSLCGRIPVDRITARSDPELTIVVCMGWRPCIGFYVGSPVVVMVLPNEQMFIAT